MVWTSRVHVGQQAAKAALLRWADRGSSTKETAKASLQRHPEKKTLQKCDSDEKQWEIMATSRSGWRHAIHKEIEAYENKRQSSQQVKCAALKARTITVKRSLSVQYAAACVHQTLAWDPAWGYTNKQSATLDFIHHVSQPYIHTFHKLGTTVVRTANPGSEHVVSPMIRP